MMGFNLELLSQLYFLCAALVIVHFVLLEN